MDEPFDEFNFFEDEDTLNYEKFDPNEKMSHIRNQARSNSRNYRLNKKEKNINKHSYDIQNSLIYSEVEGHINEENTANANTNLEISKK